MNNDGLNLAGMYPARDATIEDVGDVSLSIRGPIASVGEVWRIRRKDTGEYLYGEVTSSSEDGFVLSLYSRPHGIAPGTKVRFHTPSPLQPVGKSLLGRVLNGMGEPADEGPPIKEKRRESLKLSAYNPMQRELIESPLPTGVRAIDGFLTIGKGQKIGLFAGSGVGKSVLMGMISKGTAADVRVVALIGERGREVREFIENVLGDSLQQSVVVVSASDTPPLTKLSGLLRAVAIARWFASEDNDVLLLVDSLTRVATALRDLGLSAGEPPVAKGFTPSMYNFFPQILEQAGNFSKGSLTIVSTVLTEEEEEFNPVALTARSILDGHITLSSELASKAHYPAIDVLKSKSRVMPSIVSKRHLKNMQNIISKIALHEEYQDIVAMGLYTKGSNPDLDRTMQIMPRINSILQQDMDELTSFETTIKQMESIGNEIQKPAKNGTSSQGARG